MSRRPMAILPSLSLSGGNRGLSSKHYPYRRFHPRPSRVHSPQDSRLHFLLASQLPNLARSHHVSRADSPVRTRRHNHRGSQRGKNSQSILSFPRSLLAFALIVTSFLFISSISSPFLFSLHPFLIFDCFVLLRRPSSQPSRKPTQQPTGSG